MINRTCSLCGGSGCISSFGGLLKCKSCGIVFEDTMADSVRPADLYGPGYFQGEVYLDYEGEERLRTDVFREKMLFIRKLLKSRGRVLDAGCAGGYFMKVAAENGYEPFGIDVSPFAVRLARNGGAGHVVCGDIANTGFPDGYFSAVTMWDLLEHLHDPAAALCEAYRVLEPGGLLIVETLNIGSIWARFMRDRWPLYAPPYHLFYFTVDTLYGLLFSCGFRPGWAVPVSTRAPWRGGRGKLNLYRSPLLRRLPASVVADVVLCPAVKESRSCRRADRRRFP